MDNLHFPLLIEPEQLEQHLGEEGLIVVDLCKTEQYQQAHIPGAIHIEYPQLIAASPPVMGLLPEIDQLNNVANNLGLKQNSHVVAYDDEGGGKAARLLWTLDAMGFPNGSLVNGGLHAWIAEKRQLESKPNYAGAASFPIKLNPEVVVDKNYILDNLNNNKLTLIDARSVEEYTGVKKFAQHAGHIPGAVNLDWLLMIDQANNLKLKPKETLNEMFQKLLSDNNKEVIVYCQTHHRSALSYFVLKYLGHTTVKGYPGSWSDWGNSDDTPIET